MITSPTGIPISRFPGVRWICASRLLSSLRVGVGSRAKNRMENRSEGPNDPAPRRPCFCLAQRVSHAQEFPIGAWFPGLFNNQIGAVFRAARPGGRCQLQHHSRRSRRKERSFGQWRFPGSRSPAGTQRPAVQLECSSGLADGQPNLLDQDPGSGAPEVFHPSVSGPGTEMPWHANTADHTPGLLLDTRLRRARGSSCVTGNRN